MIFAVFDVLLAVNYWYGLKCLDWSHSYDGGVRSRNYICWKLIEINSNAVTEN